ncbi:MAG: cytochrome c1 [Alphaproteobacteria bacterium]|jgi:ubiquinol-cytochrome c reductase cytochrome c1 subunit|nr:cytochrome c1 [Alphaproteobacteria bacterium]MBO6862934.1 cytochrome c1 [Alphaproteobacteria bacterium]MEC9267079.1 cytochrome c1 [Pseudomonadota bacterium]
MRKLGLSIATAALVAFGAGQASQEAAAASAAHPPQGDFGFTGFFGKFDRDAAQRGLQVYVGVCASCHGLDLIRYRELSGLGYSEEQIKAFAAQFEVTDGPNEDGDMFTRPGEPKDRFVNPYRNVQEAAAINGGKAPPDLSLIVKARAHGLGSIGANFLDMLQGGEFATGASYVSALIGTGYVEEPTLDDKKLCKPQPAGKSQEDWEAELNAWSLPPGTYFNKWFPGCAIGMPNPLYDDAVEYTDGTAATPEQMGQDVAEFLAWASEPSMEARKETGIAVLLFLAVFTGIMIAVKRQTWANVKH